MLAFPPASSWSTGFTAPKRNEILERCATPIVPRLYLSDLYTAKQEDVLLELGITHIISAMEYVPNLPLSIPHNRRLHVDIHDHSDADVLQHLDRTTEYIKNVLSESPDNKVLVHCFQGVSRSATIVGAYIIATSERKMTADEAIIFIQSKRSIVSPNLGFRSQLAIYASRFVGSKSKPKSDRKSPSRRPFLGAILKERIRLLTSTQD